MVFPDCNETVSETSPMDEKTLLLDTNHAKRVHSNGWLLALVRAVASIIIAVMLVFMLSNWHSTPSPPIFLPNISVAFIGNSMMYYNDLPRFLELISEGHLKQKSCLHGDASLTRILETGNGMFQKFNTTNALNSDGVFDFGACTVKQLLFGHDEDLEEQVWNHVNDTNSSLRDDGTNPCLMDPSYLEYLDDHTKAPPKYDFIFINDNTRNPGRNSTRQAGLRVLESTYVPWFLETGATPVFLDTHAYWTDMRNMTDFIDVPTFTSLTYEGYKQYLTLVSQLLPSSQAPRLAPVGLAFLTVWEEDRHVWRRLFHNFDHLHASPTGTFLTAAVIHFTLFGEMPDKRVMIPQNHDFAALWSRARVMQEADEPPNPLPDFAEAVYLYDVADRVARKRHIPKSLTLYENGESSPNL